MQYGKAWNNEIYYLKNQIISLCSFTAVQEYEKNHKRDQLSLVLHKDKKCKWNAAALHCN